MTAAGGAAPEAEDDLAARLAPHLDGPFYRAQIEQARARGVDVAETATDDPCAHFQSVGWRLGLSPNRWFDTLGYLAANPEVAAMGINPFLHYLEVGLDEGRRPMPFFLDRAWRHPDLERYGRCEYGPVRHVLTFGDPPERAAGRLPEKMAVHLHLFYPDMLEQMTALLARLPCGFDLLVSVPEGADLSALDQQLRAALPRARQVILRQGPNRGRDVAPWLVGFREEIRRSDLFLHLHTKKSPHGSYHQGWGDFLGHSLLGSPAVAAQMLDLFATDAGLGMLAPAYWPMLRRAPNYGETRDLCAHLNARMGLPPLPARCPDFPAGSFFCCRSSLLAPLLDLDLSFADFPAEAGQICGTVAHAVERLLGVLPLQAGLRFDMVAVDLPYEQAGQQPRRLSLAQDPGKGPGAGVSVICTVTDPAPDLGPQLLDALEAVFGQSAPPQDVVLVEAARSDRILAAVRDRFRSQMARGQLRLMALEGRDPAAARNAALEEIRGRIVTYLEPGTLWRQDHLARITAGFAADPAAQSLYCGMIRSDRLTGAGVSALWAPPYRRADLVAGPLLDLAAFAHRRDMVDQGLRFDPDLGQGAAWDFILRGCAVRAPLQLDHVGLARRTEAVSKPALPAQAHKAVQRRHRNERLYWGQDSLQIALKVPAPKLEFKHRWGDLHLATSLARALERLGCRTRVDILPDWYDAARPEDDATLVFRGVTPYAPRPEQINMMWHISHPARVSIEEMRGYDHVFVSAYPRAEEVIAALGMQASVMLQCADPALFHPQVDLTDVPRHDLLFIGNSRKTSRWMPQACIDRGLPVAVYGAEWEGRIPPQYLQGTHVPNTRLAAYYRAARIVLNDHWPDMAAQGFVSNRIMDAGLSGALVISDRFAGEELFMGHIVTCASPAEVEEAVRHYLADEQARRAKAQELRRMVLLHHTVEQRAAQVLETLKGLMRDRLRRLR